MRLSPVLIAGLIVTAAGVLSLALYPHEPAVTSDIREKKPWIFSLTDPHASPLVTKNVTFDSPTEADSAQFFADLVSYDGIAPDARDKVKLTGVKKSGQFVYFRLESTDPAQLDSATGYATIENDDWDIIILGTGGDSVDFYQEHGIPEDLRTSGY